MTDLESLSVIYSLKHFQQYILSSKNKVKFITDHKPLIGFFKNTIPTLNRHVRWIEEFNKYKIELVYEKVKRNVFH